MSGGFRAIRVLEISDPVLPVAFDNGLVEERRVAVPMKSPVFLHPLEMELFILGKECVMPIGELLLEAKVLLMRWFGLFLEKHVFFQC